MEQRGILHCVRKNGKVDVWTMYEDPTPFVAMAMAGQMPSELPKQISMLCKMIGKFDDSH